MSRGGKGEDRSAPDSPAAARVQEMPVSALMY